MNQVITLRFQEQIINFHTGDAFVNLTQMCKPFGARKSPRFFLRMPSTKSYIAALGKSLGLLCDNRTAKVVFTDEARGRAGTWVHPYLAMECARWLSPEFSIWCNQIILCILSGQPLPKIELPAEVFALNPQRRQIIEDRLAVLNQIAAAPGRQKTQVIKELALANKGKRGFSVPRLRGLYYGWERAGKDWRVLDAYRGLYGAGNRGVETAE